MGVEGNLQALQAREMLLYDLPTSEPEPVYFRLIEFNTESRHGQTLDFKSFRLEFNRFRELWVPVYRELRADIKIVKAASSAAHVRFAHRIQTLCLGCRRQCAIM